MLAACNAYYEAVFCGLPNNKMTPNDIHANQTNSFVRIHFPLFRKPLKEVDIMSLSTHDRSGLSHDIVLPGTIDNSVLSLFISVLSFKGIHNDICNLTFLSRVSILTRDIDISCYCFLSFFCLCACVVLSVYGPRCLN